MKTIIIFLTIFFFALTVYAAEPIVKFYLNDGSTKQYNISDIDNIGLIKSNSNYVMKIFYQDTLVAYYPTEVITKIQFEKDSLKNQILNVYICGYPKTYNLFFIDSINFYTDIYQPLTIGTQVWMLKNLNVKYYRNGDSIPEVRDSLNWINLKSGALCNYNNSDSLGKIYGRLYNWYAVNDSRGLAPLGWHIPDIDEWETLTNYLGGNSIAGGKLKEAGTSHWSSPNNGATNSSGFSALPGGTRYNSGLFNYIGWTVWYLTSDHSVDGGGWFIGMGAVVNACGFYDNQSGFGCSVRCIKDK